MQVLVFCDFGLKTPIHAYSQNGYISPIWAEAPTQAIYIKNCVIADLLDVITCAKFQNEFLGVTILQGSNFPFSYHRLRGASWL